MISAEKFWSRVGVKEPDACWPWLRGLFSTGYGGVWYKGKNWYTHRVAWELTNGPIPEGLCCLHSCGNPPCCNPAHLRLGTSTDNMRDCVKEGHGGGPMLTWEEVRELRARYKAKWGAQTALAARYGVSPRTVCSIVNNKTWKGA